MQVVKDNGPKTIYLKDYTPPAFLIDTVALYFTLGEADTLVRSRLNIRRNPKARSTDTLVLDGEDLSLESLALNGRILAKTEFMVEPGALILTHVPDQFTLDITTRIHPQENTALEGLYQSGDIFCTQCEAQGFRRMTYFLDRPDVMAVFTTTLEADQGRYPVLLANGNRVEAGELADGRHFVTWHDPYPKPSYLFALVAGDLACHEDSYVTRSQRQVALKIFVESHNLDKTGHAMDALKAAMRWDEVTFGLEYDLDTYLIVAVDDFNMGAMENKGLNLFNSKYVLARPETATDGDFAAIEGVIAHEYFHNWTGNRVTCRDWFQLSLKEGLTVFRDQQFSADQGLGAVKRIEDVRRLKTYQFAEDEGPLAHPVRPPSYIEINNFYTTTVYEKGAEVVRMYHTLLGPQGFRRGMDLYFARHDGQAVTTDDFAQAMMDANGCDLTPFKRWYDQAGTPELSVAGDWDADKQTYRLTVAQSCPPTPGQPEKQPFHIPLAIGLLDTKGQDLSLRLIGEPAAGKPVTTRVLALNKAHETFVFADIPAKPVPSLLRDFSAPVKLHYPYGEAELAFLAAHDGNAFNRWAALNRYALDLMQRLIADDQAGRSLALTDAFINACQRTLTDPNLDAALIASALTLPADDDVAQLMDEVNVEAIHTVREFMRQGLAQRLREPLLTIYQATRASAPYRYHAVDAGRRRLKNLCLAYLNTLEETRFPDLAYQQFSSADNMTDTLGALAAVQDRACAERKLMLTHFHEAWRDEPLVLDKWFSLQAQAHLPDTLETVKRLTAHPRFALENPNRVRALIGAFAHGNPVRFHDPSGAGYTFITEQIKALDKLNPQIAARLAKVFTRWRKFDAPRQMLMQQALSDLAAQPRLSRDLYEVVSKSLE